MPDKRDECGCHRECFVDLHMFDRHPCTNPCIWPDCLTDAEARELTDEIMEDSG